MSDGIVMGSDRIQVALYEAAEAKGLARVSVLNRTGLSAGAQMCETTVDLQAREAKRIGEWLVAWAKEHGA